MSEKLKKEEIKICFCHNVSLSQIQDEFSQGATTFEMLQEKTRCSTGCGGCEFEVRAILEDLTSPTRKII